MRKRNISIKSSYEIEDLFKLGSFLKKQGFKMYYKPNLLSFSRILITFPKQFKGAVKRNRIRRLFKNVFFKSEKLNSLKSDFLFVVFSEMENIKYQELLKIFKNIEDFFICKIEVDNEE